MWLRLANVAVWLFAHTLHVTIWFMRKVLKKEQYVDFLMGLAQLFASIGRMMMVNAISFAIENKIEILSGEPTEDDVSEDDEDEGPDLNRPIGLEATTQHVTADGEVTELPTFKGEDGKIIPPCFDPLPEYPVFKALFDEKYGRFGKCPIVLMGKARAYNCPDLYALLAQITNDKTAPPAMRSLYGTVMSVIVQRYGHKIEKNGLN